MATAKTTAALEWLAEQTKLDVPGVCVVSGDEPFLKRLVLKRLRAAVLEADSDDDFSFHACDGDEVEWRDVLDELSTVSLFGGSQRMVVVEDADSFVSKHRGELEDYTAKPRSTGVLVLVVNSWPSNTRLYKIVQTNGLPIDGSAPTGAALIKWLQGWAKSQHQVKLDRAAAESLVDIIGPQLGRLDQELAKLAASVGPNGDVTSELVNDLVGGWRVKQTWDMLDAALEGNAREALSQLDKLLLSGEEPIALLGQIGSTLRRLAAAGRLMQLGERQGRRPALRQVLETVGVKSFVLAKTEGQLKQVGRQRALSLYDWLLETDLALKGASSQKHRARFVLEQLIVRLSTHADPRKTAAATR